MEVEWNRIAVALVPVRKAVFCGLLNLWEEAHHEALGLEVET